jgi:hypothetical protein
MRAAPEQVAGGPHLCRIDRCLREHAAAEQHRNLLGVDLVVFGLAAMEALHEALHIESVAQDKGNALVRTQIGEPIELFLN